MNNVSEIRSVTCMGLKKGDFRHTYFCMKPYASEEEFCRDWEQYCVDKAAHLRQLNAGALRLLALKVESK